MDRDLEQKLVVEAQNDIRAFSTLYDHYLPLIYRFIFNRTGNHEISEDLTSQTFLAAVENFAKFSQKPDARFGSWLYQIASNKIIDHFRSKHYKTSVLPEYEQADTSGESAENTAEKIINSELVLRVLAELNEDEQTLLSLKFFEELPNHEIAEHLGLSANNVAVKLHRALKDFKEKIKRKYPDFEIF